VLAIKNQNYYIDSILFDAKICNFIISIVLGKESNKEIFEFWHIVQNTRILNCIKNLASLFAAKTKS